MAWQFLSIGKANAEIERLAGELASVSKDRDEIKTAMEANESDIAKELVAANTAGEALKESLAAVTAERDKIAAELASAKAELQAVPVKVSQKAAEITASQGQPPIPNAPSSTPAGGSLMCAPDLMAQAEAITDPNARTEFFRKHYAAFMAAARAQRS